jgi:hypothetical protein
MNTILVGFLTIAAFIAIIVLTGKYIGSHLPGVKHYKAENDYFTSGLTVWTLLGLVVFVSYIVGAIVTSN